MTGFHLPTAGLAVGILAATASAQTSFQELNPGVLGSDGFRTLDYKVADYDGDGIDDLLALREGACALLHANGHSGLTETPGAFPSNTAHVRTFVSGDLDGDGDLDVVVGSALGMGSPEDLLLYLNDGRGRFQRAPISQMGRHVETLALLDAEGDGDLDLIVGGRSVQESGAVYINDGRAGFTTDRTRIPVGPAMRSLEVLDVDRDGDADLLVAASPNQILINDGRGVFVDEGSTRLPSGVFGVFHLLPIRDVDGDGDIDLAALGGYSGPNRLFFNDGTGVFAEDPSRVLPGGSAGGLVGLAEDADGDGDVDLVVGTHQLLRTLVYYNDGTGRFADGPHPSGGGEFSSGLGLYDQDGDGDAELFTASHNFYPGAFGSRTTARVLVNHQRQLTAAASVPLGGILLARIHAAPGHSAVLGWAGGFSPSPRVFPFGTLWLDPLTMGTRSLAVVPPQGVHSEALFVPVDPSLRGLTFQLQAFDFDPTRIGHSRFTNVIEARVF